MLRHVMGYRDLHEDWKSLKLEGGRRRSFILDLLDYMAAAVVVSLLLLGVIALVRML